MATKTKTTKTKAVKPAKSKSTTVVDMRRPRNATAILALLTDGGNVNKGKISPQEYMKMHAAYADGSGPGLVLYQPGLVQTAAAGSGLVAACGRGKAQPKNWDDSLGKWGCVTDDDGEVTSGDKINKVRLQHSRNLTKRTADGCLADIPCIGQVVLGAEGINAQITGCYAFIVDALKSHCFEGKAQTAKLVGLINADPCIETLEHGGEIVWPSLTAIDWGYLVKGGKRLSHDQIVKSDGKGVAFEALDETIVGAPISMTKLVTAVKALMSKASTKRDGDDQTAWDRFGYESDEDARAAVTTNITTLTRFDPRSLGCYGFRSVQCGIPIFSCFSADGQTKMVNMVIGARLPIEYAENCWDAQARTAETTPVVAKPKAKKAAKPKASKPKRTPVESVTVADPVVEVVEVVDPADGSAAPPVEDTTTEDATTAADLDAEDVALAADVAE